MLPIDKLELLSIHGALTLGELDFQLFGVVAAQKRLFAFINVFVD